MKHKVAEKTGVKVTTCNLLVADSTAAVVLQLVNDEVERVQPADILRLTSGARVRRAGRRPGLGRAARCDGSLRDLGALTSTLSDTSVTSTQRRSLAHQIWFVT